MTALRIARWAHRGAGKTAPENTLVAIREGARRGFEAVEFDTMPTADGHWILNHDWTTGRTLRPAVPPASATDCAAPAAQPIVRMTLAQVRACEAGSWLDARFAGEPVPLLSEALQVCAQAGMQVNVELKLDMQSGVYTQEHLLKTAQSLLQELQSSPYAAQAGALSGRLLVSSFGLEGLYALRQSGYRGRLAPLFEVFDDTWVEHARNLDAEAVHTHHSQADAQRVRRVHTTGRAFRVYTVNDSQRLHELDAMGVDDCFTDNMDFAPTSATY